MPENSDICEEIRIVITYLERTGDERFAVCPIVEPLLFGHVREVVDDELFLECPIGLVISRCSCRISACEVNLCPFAVVDGGIDIVVIVFGKSDAGVQGVDGFGAIVCLGINECDVSRHAVVVGGVRGVLHGHLLRLSQVA